MNTEIEAKIIKLLSSNQVIINKGKNDGIIKGMVFGIKLILPDIVDPDDEKNVLSNIFYEKAEIRIDTVFDKMSFALVIPKKSAFFSADMTSSLGYKYDYPAMSGEILLSSEAWDIRIGDIAYFKKKKEDHKKE